MSKFRDASKIKTPEFSHSPSILLVVSPYYTAITDQLIDGATKVLEKARVGIDLIEVPGALEIPTAIKLSSKHFSGFVALGCVIRGETSHYETVANESARALSSLGLEGICIGNGILTVENFEQARARANPLDQNKGGAAAVASLRLIELYQNLIKKKNKIS
tara:strand:- start:529 stop:1014 length:486 start_codon:yes stop_codon:yes gene_type:complete